MLLHTLATLALAGVIYAQAGTVTDAQEGGPYALDTVTITDAHGREYVTQADDLQAGDAVALVMYDAGTPDTVADDVVLSVRYVAQ